MTPKATASGESVEKRILVTPNPNIYHPASGEIGTELQVHQVQPLVDPRWNEFLGRHPRASVFHTVEWLKALQQTYGYEPVVFTTSPPGQELQNGFAVCRVESWLTGHRLVSLPFSDHCDPLIDNDHDQCAIIEALERELREKALRYIELPPMTALPHLTATLTQSNYPYTFHQVDLKPDLDALFLTFHKDSTQRKIRRAQREALVYEEGRSGALLDMFYDLLLMTRRRHQIPPQPRRWFENLISCFGDS